MAKFKQTRRDDVPNADHVARYCNHQRVIRDPLTDEIKGVYPQAFALREKIRDKGPETYLSASWLEFFGRDAGLDHQFKAALTALSAKHSGVKKQSGVKLRGAFARLNVGRILEVGTERGHKLRVRNRSTSSDPGYASIDNTPLNNSDMELLAAFARSCIEVVEIAQIDASSR
jgi:hypothetical protein